MADDINDLFGALLELKWRDISVPYTETELELRQDLVIHKFADRDGAHIESTGRAPIQVTARIPFLNGLTPAASEKWHPEALYPGTWRSFFAACADKSSGTLQHPELGSLTCKCDAARTRWAADVRSGVWVSVTWIESDDTGVDLEQDLAQPSPLAQINVTTTDLDTQVAAWTPPPQPTYAGAAGTGSGGPVTPPSLPIPEFSFSSLGAALAAIVDTSTILEKEYGGRVDNIIYQANELETALNLAANASPTNWPIFQSCERMKDAAYAIKAQPLPTKGPTVTKATQVDGTLARAAASVGASVADIIKLNPQLVGLPYVPKGTMIRHYPKKSAA